MHQNQSIWLISNFPQNHPKERKFLHETCCFFHVWYSISKKKILGRGNGSKHRGVPSSSTVSRMISTKPSCGKSPGITWTKLALELPGKPPLPGNLKKHSLGNPNNLSYLCRNKFKNTHKQPDMYVYVCTYRISTLVRVDIIGHLSSWMSPVASGIRNSLHWDHWMLVGNQSSPHLKVGSIWDRLALSSMLTL